MSWVEIKSIHELETFYLSKLDSMRLAARGLGYALGLHGTLKRDMDLIAVPWVENHADKDELARVIQHAACGMTMAKYDWESKPKGRLATCFPICWIDHGSFDEIPKSLGHVDLSVVSSPNQT